MPAFIDRTGEIHGEVQIIRELGKGLVECRCLKCSKIDKYTKGDVIRQGDRALNCKHCHINNKMINRVGEVYRSLKIMKEMKGGIVNCKCIDCGQIDNYRKADVIALKLLCKHCGTTIINRTGEIFNKLQIIKELGKNKVICKCTDCGYEDEYTKGSVTLSMIHCKNCHIIVKEDFTGSLHRDLKILKELGERKVLCECIKCKYQEIYERYQVLKNNALCKNCGTKIIDTTGKMFNGLKVIKELGNSTILCKCIKCGHEDNYNKQLVTKHNALCKGCSSRLKYILGSVFGELEIIKELGSNKVNCRCTKCNTQDNYSKYYVIHKEIECKHCGLKRDYAGKIVNNITILELSYTGRDKNKYYNCKCNKCEEELILTREEIVKYSCGRG